MQLEVLHQGMWFLNLQGLLGEVWEQHPCPPSMTDCHAGRSFTRYSYTGKEVQVLPNNETTWKGQSSTAFHILSRVSARQVCCS